jgi:uncharacterized FlgJ-related protein
MMAQAGAIVFQKREAFIREFIPIFQSFYSFISQDKEVVLIQRMGEEFFSMVMERLYNTIILLQLQQDGLK